MSSGWVGTHAWCHLFRVVQAKFETGMCEIKILGSEVLWCVFATLVQGWHTCEVQSVPAKFKTGMCEMKIFGLKFVVCLGTLVQDGLAHMRGVLWRAVPAKFKTGMCEIKILGSEVLSCVFATLVQGWHRCVVSSVPSCSGRVQNRDV